MRRNRPTQRGLTRNGAGMSQDDPIRTCLYGGSFNPPHVCHVLAATWALSTCPIDEVWWVPTYHHAFGKNLVDFEHRVTMCELAVRTLAGQVQVCPIEREMGGESRTIDTVRTLQARHPDRVFSLLIGADLLPDTPRWKEWETLEAMLPVYVLGRSGFGNDHADPTFALPNVSSSSVREAVAASQADFLTAWLPSLVRGYIARHGLYVPEDT